MMVIEPGKPAPYKHIFDALFKMAQQTGVRSLYKGLPVQLIGIIPEKALKLSINDSARWALRNPDNTINLSSEAMAGGTAGFCQVVVTSPMERYKILMQLQHLKPIAERETVLQVANKILRTGIRGIYTGAGATLSRDVFFSIIYFPFFSRTKQYFGTAPNDSGLKIFHRPGSQPTEQDITKRINLFGTFTAGMLAGGISAWLATPMDVVKTRLQAEGGMARWGGLASCTRLTYKNEGFKAFFKGATGRVLLIGPLFGVVLFTYEFMPRYIPL
jgi:solute carrier family 25 aspartate/glutamate transporter 12/13